MAFVSFLMLHHFSGIIYLILFALHPHTSHLEETSKLIFSTKPFPLRLPSLSDILSGFWLLCILAILSGKVGFEPQFTGGVSNLYIKKISIFTIVNLSICSLSFASIVMAYFCSVYRYNYASVTVGLLV